MSEWKPLFPNTFIFDPHVVAYNVRRAALCHWPRIRTVSPRVRVIGAFGPQRPDPVNRGLVADARFWSARRQHEGLWLSAFLACACLAGAGGRTGGDLS